MDLSRGFLPKTDIYKGEAELFHPNGTFDYLAPEDIGCVSGALLAEGQGPRIVYLCGPKLMTQKEAAETVGQVIGKEVRVKEIGVERFKEKLSHMPPPVVQNLADAIATSDDITKMYPEALHRQGVANLRNFKGAEPTAFVDWVKEHRELFE